MQLQTIIFISEHEMPVLLIWAALINMKKHKTLFCLYHCIIVDLSFVIKEQPQHSARLDLCVCDVYPPPWPEQSTHVSPVSPRLARAGVTDSGG